MLLRPETEAALQRVDRLLERVVVERDEQPALVAHEVMVVMVMLLERSPLVASDAVADVDAGDQPQILKDLDTAVDACDAYRAGHDPVAQPRTQPRVDLMHRQCTVLTCEQLDQHLPRPTASMPRSAKPVASTVGPRLLIGCHRERAYRYQNENDNENQNHYRYLGIVTTRLPGPTAVTAVTAILAASLAVAGCGRGGAGAHASSDGNSSRILAVGAESEYANVISQIGGRYVSVSAIMSNPSTDPHTFEASPNVAQTVSSAKLVVQNGVGYDTFMNKIESASPNSGRRVLVVQKLLGLPDSTRNPHLWYEPTTMPKVAAQLVSDLSALSPRHASYFAANARRFDASLNPWLHAIARFAHAHHGTPVATTEPVGDYMLQAAGTRNLTPWSMQADVMNGVDPAPQDISLETNLLKDHRVKVFLYNQQVTDTLTETFLKQAVQCHVPVVGLYETMPAGYDYQSWMLAEAQALEQAVTTGRSTTRLK